MTGKRFTDVEVDKYYGLICMKHDEQFHSYSEQSLEDLLNALNDENEHYKSILFELVETALTDKNCRELYCKGILDIFDKANSLNQARDMIKEFLE